MPWSAQGKVFSWITPFLHLKDQNKWVTHLPLSRKTKPRTIETGLYPLNNRFEQGCIRCWLPVYNPLHNRSPLGL
jgi:hypothetical protein